MASVVSLSSSVDLFDHVVQALLVLLQQQDIHTLREEGVLETVRPCRGEKGRIIEKQFSLATGMIILRTTWYAETANLHRNICTG